jgi:hypothetical protein
MVGNNKTAITAAGTKKPVSRDLRVHLVRIRKKDFVMKRFVPMKTSSSRNGSFLRFMRRIFGSFLDIFRFTEADASVLLSAYGLHAFEIDRLGTSRAEQPEDASKRQINHRKRKRATAAPILIGVHPDFIMGNWKTAAEHYRSGQL